MPDPRLHIRPAHEGDLAAVLALYAQPSLDNGAVLPLDDPRTIFARFSAGPDYTLYVADLGGMVVGTFALLIMDNLGHLGAPSAVVEDVVVAPERQGEGIGRAMMTEALAKTRAKSCYKVVLSSNMTRERAHRFYETIGFERHGYSFRLDSTVLPAP